MNKVYKEARDAAFQELFDIALQDKSVLILSADTGALMFKKFMEHIPKQFFNVGVAEQNAISVAAGLALTGRKVFVFGISNFVTLRCFEQIKIDICCMDLPVTIIGMGTGYVYPKDGPTHHMTDILSLTRTLPGITVWSPSDYLVISASVRFAYESDGPTYIYMDKGPFEPIYDLETNFENGLHVLREGRDVTIVATGIMVPQALRVSDELKKKGLDVGIIDLYRIKPVNRSFLVDAIKACRRIVTLEENTVIGGLGSLVSEVLCESNVTVPLKRLGIPDIYRCEIGDREELRSMDGLDVVGITKTVSYWMSA